MVTTAGTTGPAGDCLRTEGACGHADDKFINIDCYPVQGGDGSCQGWAVDNEHTPVWLAMTTNDITPPLLPAVLTVHCSEGVRRVHVKRHFCYLSNLILGRGDLLEAGLTEPLHPILSLFRFLKVFPLSLRHLGPRARVKRRGQRAH